MTDKQLKANSIVEDLIALKNAIKRNQDINYDETSTYVDIINDACNEIKELVQEEK